jgi:hypothetical protein
MLLTDMWADEACGCVSVTIHHKPAYHTYKTRTFAPTGVFFLGLNVFAVFLLQRRVPGQLSIGPRVVLDDVRDS